MASLERSASGACNHADFRSNDQRQLQDPAYDTFLIVKQKLQDPEGIPPNQVRFIHRGKALKDDSKTLSDYEIRNHGTLTLC
jgi:hypothetical protein